jgi:excisionase family DNA binding protein
MKTTNKLPEIMDVRTCAKYLHVSSDTMYMYASTGFIPGFKLGNRWRFRKTLIDNWIDGQIKKNGKNGENAKCG